MLRLATHRTASVVTSSDNLFRPCFEVTMFHNQEPRAQYRSSAQTQQKHFGEKGLGYCSSADCHNLIPKHQHSRLNHPTLLHLSYLNNKGRVANLRVLRPHARGFKVTVATMEISVLVLKNATEGPKRPQKQPALRWLLLSHSNRI